MGDKTERLLGDDPASTMEPGERLEALMQHWEEYEAAAEALPIDVPDDRQKPARDRPESTVGPEIQVRHWAYMRLELAYRQEATGEVWQSDDDLRLEAGVRIRDLAAELGPHRVEDIVREVEREWAEQVGAENWQSFERAIIVESYEGRYPGLPCPFDEFREPYLRAGSSATRRVESR